MSEPLSPTRREFTQSLAALAAAGVTAGAAQAQGDPHAMGPDLIDVVKGRYGKLLTPAQLDEIKRAGARNLRLGEFLGKYKLQNGDEPAFVFRADVP